MDSSVSSMPAEPRRGMYLMLGDKSEHELLAEAMHEIAERLAACRTGEAQRPEGIDAFAAGAVEHLADLEPGDLPLAARTIWTDHVARPLKADPTQPLTAQGLAGLRSWPAARIKRLARALAKVEGIVKEAEVEARNEIVRATISREYS